MDTPVFASICKHYRVFLTSVILFAAAGFGLNQVIPAAYEAKATLVANFDRTQDNVDNKYNEILANQMLTKTYSEVIRSMTIANIVKNDLHSPLSANELLKKIEVNTDPGALILTIMVKDGAPENAVAIANAFAESFVKHSSSIVSLTNVTILDLADQEASSTPVSPRKTFNIAISVFIGLIVGTSLSMLLETRRMARRKKAEVKGSSEERTGLITEIRRA